MDGRLLEVVAVRADMSAAEHVAQMCDRYSTTHTRTVVLMV